MNGATRPQPALPQRGRETTGLRALPKRRGELSGLSVVQWSAVTQMELSQVLMVQSAGELEVVVPAIDDDGWDAKVHLRGEFGSELTVQAKCTGNLLVRESRAPDLKIHFKLPRRRISRLRSRPAEPIPRNGSPSSRLRPGRPASSASCGARPNGT